MEKTSSSVLLKNGSGSTYRRCVRCVMDTTDPYITFDKEGVCNHCYMFDRRIAWVTQLRDNPQKYLNPLVEQIKNDGFGKEYDCVIGVSGGIDSTYTAYLCKNLGLRPFAVHLDNGWNSSLAVTNIYNCLQALGLDLYTEVVNWESFKDLQLAFLKASTPDSEIPTDHAIGAVLLRQAICKNVRYVVVGQNVATEGVGTPAWSTGYHDWKYIRTVYRQFCQLPLKGYPHYSVWEHAWWKIVRGIKRVDILNYIPYEKEKVEEHLKKEMGWQNYSGKHHESIFTRFFQCYILPTKFGFDKRLSHFSPLILTGKMSRDDAIEKLQSPPCSAKEMAEDKRFVLKKLGIEEAEFQRLMDLPHKTIYDYPSYERNYFYQLGLRLFKLLKGTGID